MREELTGRLVLDVTGPAGDQLVIMPIHLGKSGVAEGVQAAQKEADRLLRPYRK